ncbi:ATP-binding protein [Rothia nasimurium]|nr:ATP-binding protein [Rothia nasimurium]
MSQKDKRQPIQWINGNIFVNRKGIPYAIWRLTGLSYGMSPHAHKQAVHAAHRDLFQGLTGEYKILGLTSSTSSAEIVGRMLEGVDNPGEHLMNEVRLIHQELSALPPGVRSFFLITPLTSKNPKEYLDRILWAGDNDTRELLGLPPNPPTAKAYKEWALRAATIEGRIPAAFKPRPVGLAALTWISTKLATRGATWIETPIFEEPTANGWTRAKGLIEPITDPMAKSDIDDPAIHTRPWKMAKRRYIKVTPQNGDYNPSYQAFTAIAAPPQAGYQFPGSEFINIASELPNEIDFCLLIKSIPAEKAIAKNRRAEREIMDQYTQRSSKAGGITGGSNAEIDKSAQALREYQTKLKEDEREVEIVATCIFSTSGATPEEALTQIKDLETIYKTSEWILDSAAVEQQDLFWDFYPGSIPSPTSSQYAQLTVGDNFAMGVPICEDTLGMRNGFRIATNITTGRFQPVYINLAALAEADFSGSVACIGELGSGKSVAMKTIASNMIDRGAQLVAVDHSANHEWAALAHDLTRANVVDFDTATVSVDPFKLFHGDKKQIRYMATTFLTALLSLNITDARGRLLSSIFKAYEEDQITLTSLNDLKKYLLSDAIDEARRSTAREIGETIEIFSEVRIGAPFFNPDLPAADLTYDATVFATHGMDLPTPEDLASETALNQLSLEKRVGRATYAYLAALGRIIGYQDDSRDVLFVVDEAYHMTSSPEGHREILTGIKTGRKHKFHVIIGTHSAEEIGDQNLRSLITLRFVFRTRDEDLARTNLAWLDKHYASSEHIKTLTEDTSPIDEATDKVPTERRGECFFKDHRGKVGKVKIEIPLDPSRRKTVLTSPPTRTQQPHLTKAA